MPELPDLLYVMGVLRPALVGRTVAAARLTAPVVLRSLVKGDLSLLVGRTLDELLRRGHFLVFRFGDLDLAVNPMLAGRFKLAEPASRLEATAAFVLTFQPGPDLRYLDDKKMGKAYLLPAGAWKGVPGMEGGGLDVLSPDFTLERFRERLRGRRDQVRAFVMDKRALDSLGNAYADEVLFEAGIHPKTWCRALGPEDAARLHAAIVHRDARRRRGSRAPPRADRGEGPRLPAGPPEDDLPALRRQGAQGGRARDGQLLLPALPAGDAAGPRGLAEDRGLTPCGDARKAS